MHESIDHRAPDDVAAERANLPALLADPSAVTVYQPSRADVVTRWLFSVGVFTLYLFCAGSFGLWDPWETHYGEVARNMLESYDWVNPWWGYRHQIGSEPVAGNWFYSKPIFIFWSEVVLLKTIGLSDWAFRLPVALIGASMVTSLYWALERAASTRHALFAAGAVALSPFIYMVSRQAQTDMPFVGLMTMAMAFVLVAFYGRRVPTTDGCFFAQVVAFVGFLALNLIPQWGIIATDLADPNAGASLSGPARWGAIIQQNGVWHLLVYVPIGLAVLASVLWPIARQRRAVAGWDDAFKDRWQRRIALLCFYMLVAQATYAKGLLGFMLPGAILMAYFAVDRRWRLLARLQLARGVPLFFVTVLPWYVAMFCRHGMAYYNRFFVHDHFNRVGAGVHQIDSGTFEHFIEWLGFGLFPWSAFAPMALVSAVWLIQARRRSASQGRDAGELTPALHTMLLVWFAVAFGVFTLSSTKFHHYILPAAPALAMLIGLYLAELRALPDKLVRLNVLLALGFFAVLLIDLLDDQQTLRDLFTYKYDRPLPENLPLDWSAPVNWKSDTHPIVPWSDTPFARHVGPVIANLLSVSLFRYETWMATIAGLGGVALVGMMWRRLRRLALGLFAVTALLLAFWTLNYYMPMLSSAWSQRYLFEAYYDDCTPYDPPEPIREAYTPLLSRIGLDFIPEFFDAKGKRVCREDIISWLITWRGETFYSNNEIRPINKENPQFVPYLEDFNKGRSFYVLMERGRTKGFKDKLDRASRTLRDKGVDGWQHIESWKVEVISNDNAYFVVGRATPVEDSKAARAPPTRPAPSANPLAGRAGAAAERARAGTQVNGGSAGRPVTDEPVNGPAEGKPATEIPAAAAMRRPGLRLPRVLPGLRGQGGRPSSARPSSSLPSAGGAVPPAPVQGP